MSLLPSKELNTFENPNVEIDYLIKFDIPEFTCLCPLTSQPDFAHLYIEYVPDLMNIELKSLKSYFWTFRDKGAFHEAITNQILKDLVKAISPRFMKITANWNVRGGIYTSVEVEHKKNN
jgi:7-cyano-7-deazaguanine reductase